MDLAKLKEDLLKIIILNNDYKKAKQKDKQSIDVIITILKNNLIKNYNLTNYDTGIQMEMYDNEYFIENVKTIIVKLEDKDEYLR